MSNVLHQPRFRNSDDLHVPVSMEQALEDEGNNWRRTNCEDAEYFAAAGRCS